MAVRQAIGLVGKAHLNGHGQAVTKVMSPGGAIGGLDAARTPPAIGWGTNGWAHLNVRSVASGPFVRNCIVTGSVSGVRARVLEDRSADLNLLIVERVALPVNNLTLTPEWFQLDETIASDVGSTTALIGSVTGIGSPVGETGEVNAFGVQIGGQQLAGELFNPILNSLIPSDGITGATSATGGIYYYRDAQLADLLPVSATAGIGFFRTIFGAFTGSRALVLGTTNIGAQLYVAIARRSGDPGAGFNTSENINLEALLSGGPSGTISGTNTTLTDTTKSMAPNAHVLLKLNLTGGTGNGSRLTIRSNTATTFSYDSTATGGSTTFLDDSGQNWPVNAFVGLTLHVTSGPGSGQNPVITSNTATRLVFGAVGTTLAAGSVYNVGFTPDATTVYNVGATAAIATVQGAIVTRTVGEWGPFAMRPNLNGIGQRWNLPPFGCDIQGRFGAIGVDPYIVSNAFAKWGGNLRVIKSMTTIAPTSGNQGGAAYGVIPCSGTFPLTGTLVLSATVPTIITGPGSYSATVVAVNAGLKQIWVKNQTKTLASSTSPFLANGNTVSWTGNSTGSATVLDNVYGSMRGAQDYIQFFVDKAAAETKLGGDTLAWQGLFLEPWEGDVVLPIAAAGTSLGLDAAVVTAGYLALAANLRSDLATPALACTFFAHRQESHRQSQPSHATIVRLALAQLSSADVNSRVVTPDEFEIAPAVYGGVAADANGLYLDTYAYPLVGLKMWRAFEVATTPLNTGQLNEALPIVVIFGQSQAAAIGGNAAFWSFEVDPLLGKVSSMTAQLGGPVSTLDSRILIFNALTSAWEVMDGFTNATTFGNGSPGVWAIEMSLAQRLIDRYPRIGIIKVPFGASCMQALTTRQQQGTWAPAFSTPTVSPASVVVTDISSGGSSLFRFTASANGVFTPFRVSEWITIDNTNVIPSQETRQAPAISPALIMAIGAAGNTIDIQPGIGSFIGASGQTNFGQPFPATETGLTFTQGPVQLRTSAAAVITSALDKCMSVLRRIPSPELIVAWQGEGDAEDVLGSTGYADAYAGALNWMRGLFPRVFNKGKVPVAVLKISSLSPVGDGGGGADDLAVHLSKIAALQAAQDSLKTRSDLGVVTTISTDGLPLVLGSFGYPSGGSTWTATGGAVTYAPADYRKRGIHHTPRGAIGSGFLVDAALDSFGGLFPPHPLGTLGSGEFETSPNDTGTTQATTIVVETGSGSTTSESYIDVAFADAYWANRGDPITWSSATTLQKEAALRESGLIGIDGQFGRLWKGRRLFLNQSMDWPRMGMTNRDGWAVIPGTIPDRLKAAQAEMALTSLTEQMVVDEGPDDRGIDSSKKTAADIGSIELTWSKSSGRGAQTRRMRAEKLLEPFLDLDMRVSRA